MNVFKKSLSILAASAFAFQMQAQYMEHIYDYIENPSVYEENQEEGHAYYKTDNSISLNGKWRFLLAETPEELPSHFYVAGYKDSGWDLINVPSNWEML